VDLSKERDNHLESLTHTRFLVAERILQVTGYKLSLPCSREDNDLDVVIRQLDTTFTYSSERERERVRDKIQMLICQVLFHFLYDATNIKDYFPIFQIECDRIRRKVTKKNNIKKEHLSFPFSFMVKVNSSN